EQGEPAITRSALMLGPEILHGDRVEPLTQHRWGGRRAAHLPAGAGEPVCDRSIESAFRSRSDGRRNVPRHHSPDWPFAGEPTPPPSRPQARGELNDP